MRSARLLRDTTQLSSDVPCSRIQYNVLAQVITRLPVYTQKACSVRKSRVQNNSLIISVKQVLPATAVQSTPNQAKAVQHI